MKKHRTSLRVIYGDTDAMGLTYHSNYFRWFETGRNEMFRDLGLPYSEIEKKGYFLPVSECYCKFCTPVKYDDVIIIETWVDSKKKGGMKFEYTIYRKTEPHTGPAETEDAGKETLCARGFTIHAFLNDKGKVIRPPGFITELMENAQND